MRRRRFLTALAAIFAAPFAASKHAARTAWRYVPAPIGPPKHVVFKIGPGGHFNSISACQSFLQNKDLVGRNMAVTMELLPDWTEQSPVVFSGFNTSPHHTITIEGSRFDGYAEEVEPNHYKIYRKGGDA